MNKIRIAALRLTVIAWGLSAWTLVLSDDLLIRNVIIVSADRDGPTSLTSVVVRDGLIAEIGSALSAEESVSYEVLDGEGRYLVPGLIDGHTHLAEVPGMRSDQEARYPMVSSAARWQIPRSYLYHGFTTVIDLNSRPAQVEHWNSARLRPTAYFCGAAPVFDGYPMRFAPKPLRYKIMPYFLYDESRAGEFPDNIDADSHMPSVVVDKIKSDGAICVKTHYESGFGGSGNWPVPSIGLIRSLVEEAHRRDLPVLLHANSQEAHQFGLDTSVDAIVHGIWTWTDRVATDLNVEITTILDEISDKRIGWQPTVQVLYGERDLHDPNYFSRDSIADVLPQGLIEWYQTEDGQWWRNRMGEIPAIKRALERQGWQRIDAGPIERVSKALSYLASNDAHLIFGSDTPSDPTYANPPGLNGRLEMQRWVESGVSPVQIFHAATLSNAKFFGLQDRIGTIEVGKRADMLILRSNPLKDVSAYDEIDVVILNGRPIPREELSARNSVANSR